MLQMLIEYIQAVLEKARYEIIEDDDPYYGEISREEWLGEWDQIWSDHVNNNPHEFFLRDIRTIEQHGSINEHWEHAP